MSRQPLTATDVEALLTGTLDQRDPDELARIAKKLFAWGEILTLLESEARAKAELP